MSWVKSLSRSEDVFDEDGDELNLQSKEWVSNMKKRVKDGYVDGIDAGEEASLQLGFNQGFKEGAARTEAVGKLKGIISAICCWCQMERPETPIPASVNELLQLVTQHEDRIMEDIRTALENPPPSVSDVSESMDDLDMEQADQGCCGKGCEDAACCRKGDNMDVDVHHQTRKLRSSSTDVFSSFDEELNLLVQRCVAVVTELGLPQELIGHIQEPKNV